MFLAKFWRLTSVKTSYQNCLAFVVLCSNRWLKIEVTARQKSVFPRCQTCSRIGHNATSYRDVMRHHWPRRAGPEMLPEAILKRKMALQAPRRKALLLGRRKRTSYVVNVKRASSRRLLDLPEVAPRPYRDTSRRDLASRCVQTIVTNLLQPENPARTTQNLLRIIVEKYVKHISISIRVVL